MNRSGTRFSSCKNILKKPGYECITSFHATGLFPYTWKHQKTSGFLFSGGTERNQWHELVNLRPNKILEEKQLQKVDYIGAKYFRILISFIFLSKIYFPLTWVTLQYPSYNNKNTISIITYITKIYNRKQNQKYKNK